MAVSFKLDFNLIGRSAALASIIGESLGLTGLSGKALSSAIFTRTKGKSDKEKRDIFTTSTRPTHVEFINPDDAKTSETCQAVLRGKHIWLIGDSDIKIAPLHWFCRSSNIFFRKRIVA